MAFGQNSATHDLCTLFISGLVIQYCYCFGRVYKVANQ